MPEGHQVRLIPAQLVKPYRKSNKNDFIDAEAIAEAVTNGFQTLVSPRNKLRPQGEQLDVQGRLDRCLGAQSGAQ